MIQAGQAFCVSLSSIQELNLCEHLFPSTLPCCGYPLLLFNFTTHSRRKLDFIWCYWTEISFFVKKYRPPLCFRELTAQQQSITLQFQILVCMTSFMGNTDDVPMALYLALSDMIKEQNLNLLADQILVSCFWWEMWPKWHALPLNIARGFLLTWTQAPLSIMNKVIYVYTVNKG